ncbi:aldose 1-epimerase family protein [Pedobacter sp. JY14-1]|uniref:aldose 1-epimerase family protein n=1 Tax=Pedobacter sp. JY14-1 TaxID=3034151 RepID=UPI0023E31F24|nr:aldose 1-epimerase family protein [Pedobacter sp. JY14-1]
MIVLQNEYASVTLSEKGAELQHFLLKENNREYMWGGDPAYWGKHSPVLFPVIGALKENTYAYNGHQYHLSRHGFARDRTFAVAQKSSTEVSFSLSDDEDTLRVYPFKFRFYIHYRLEGTRLSCTYEVVNPSEFPLLFSVGGHPAFAVPVNADITYDDYFLEFSDDHELVCHKIDHDLISEHTETLMLTDRKLPLSHKLFYEDALVVKTLKSNRISLRCNKAPEGIHFDFEGFPFFGIWSAKDADFVCLEPWCGIADSTGHDQQLKDKEGIQELAPGERWQRSWAVTAF